MTPLTRVLLSLIGVLAAAALGASPVASQEYPVQSGSLTIGDDDNPGGTTPDSADEVVPGEEIRIAGGGFVPGSEVTITLESDPVVLIVTTADANGEIDVVVTVPADAPIGDHTVKATGAAATGGRLVLARPATVVPQASSETAARPPTTADDEPGLLSIPSIVGMALAAALGVGYVGYRHTRTTTPV